MQTFAPREEPVGRLPRRRGDECRAQKISLYARQRAPFAQQDPTGQAYGPKPPHSPPTADPRKGGFPLNPPADPVQSAIGKVVPLA